MSTGLQHLPEIEAHDGEVISEATSSTSAMIKKAELEAMVVTAKRYPRSITRFMNEVLSIATLNQDVAKTCFYRKPQGNSFVEGPSIRLAEIAASRYGNLWTAARIIQESANFVVAQAETIDLETVTTWQTEVRRRITDHRGRRYSDDMIVTTCNAAVSIASRNAVLRAIPRALIDPIWHECRILAGGKGESIEVLRKRWLDWARANNVKEAELYAAIGIGGADDLGIEQFAQLNGINTAIQDGETTWDDVFRPQQLGLGQSAVDAAVVPKGDRIAAGVSRAKGKAAATPDDAGLWPAGKE